jgi:hypothetical protein
VTGANYPHIRARFADSRWPDLRSAGTDYVDLAMTLRTARTTDGCETVWFYQRLSVACARHGRALSVSPGGSRLHEVRYTAPAVRAGLGRTQVSR